MIYFVDGIALMALTCFLLGMRGIVTMLPQLVKQPNGQRLRGISIALLIAPAAVMIVVITLYFTVWRSEPLLRFTHMFWVLGFWMIGTCSFFMFTLLVTVELKRSHFALISALLSVSLAIYSTPLPQFLKLFSQAPDLIFPMVFAIINIWITWLTTYRVWLLFTRH